MKFEVKLNNRNINIHLIKKRTTRHTYLRIKGHNTIQITSSLFFTKKEAFDLINKKAQWILKAIEKKEENFLNEDEFYFLGVKHKNLDNRDLDKFYRNEAKKIIPPLVEEFSKQMNLFPTSIKYRKNKNTWGSCNYKNGLNFNTLLVKFPLEVVEYVVIHELAHIEHKNHSKSFWKLVQKYCSDYKNREKLLKSFL